jgi:flagellar biosynthesis chaperone FliJ
MHSFQFRLDRVLTWRAKQAQMEENRLAACLGAHKLLEGRIAQFQAERLIVERDLLEQHAIPAAEFMHLARYRLRAQRQEIDFNEQRRNSEKIVGEQRGRVQKAQQRVRLLEKLRERRLSEYRYAFDRELETVAEEAHNSRRARGE